MSHSIAYLARGRLFLHEPDQPSHEIESAFARQAMERQARTTELDGWKSNTSTWNSLGLSMPELGDWQSGQVRRPIRIQSVSRGQHPGQLFYALDMGNVGGLFQYEVAEVHERRLLHREGFQIRDLARHPTEDYLAFSSAQEDGTSRLIIAQDEGRRHNRIAGGDSMDEAPSWVAGGGRRLVYQSAAMARNQAGVALGLAPYTIEMLDIDTQAISVVAQSETDDLLQPRMLADETLFFIRRPYKPAGHRKLDVKTLALDVVLFPYRVVRAMFFFMNFISVMFAGKPLATSSNLQPQPDETRYLRVWGRMIDAKRAIEKADDRAAADLVPKDWQLVRRDTSGSETVLASHVLAYDVNDGGDVVFTNGSRIVRLDRDGQQHALCSDQMIQAVMFAE